MPPTLPVRRLVRVAALFGINENRARVALSRMAARGEVVADGRGGYTLAGPLLERSGRLAAARAGAPEGYDGRWHVVVVTAPPGGPPAERRERRAALRAARLGELRDGAWLRPANLALSLDAHTAASVVAFGAVPSGDARALAASVFDLSGWARRAERLLAALDAVDLDAAHALAEGFERDAEVLRHLQRDPLLPAVLLAPGWPGARLRERFDAFDAAYRARLADAHRTAALTTALRSPASRLGG